MDENIAANWDLYMITILTLLLGIIMYMRRPFPQPDQPAQQPAADEIAAAPVNLAPVGAEAAAVVGVVDGEAAVGAPTAAVVASPAAGATSSSSCSAEISSTTTSKSNDGAASQGASSSASAAPDGGNTLDPTG